MLPEGLSSSEPSVRRGNLISVRTALMAELSFALEQETLIEQPDHGRGLIHLPRWQDLCSRTTVYRSKCKQGAYSAETPKPTALYSNHTKWALLRNSLSEADQLRLRTRGKELVTKKRDSEGRVRITGRRQELKSTQAYTADFGRALVSAWHGECASWFAKPKREGSLETF